MKFLKIADLISFSGHAVLIMSGLVVVISGVGVFFSRQDAGLLPAKPDSGNCLAFYCWLFKTFTPTFKTFTPTRTEAVFCLSRRQ
jgi:hypothetical protein